MPQTYHTVSELAEQVLTRIQSIRANLDPTQAMLLGWKTTEKMLSRWVKLERHVMAAKLAIVRDEFLVRFPGLNHETEGFTFGIQDSISDRYMLFLKPRNPDDIMQMTFAIIEDVFGKTTEKELPGIAHFVSNLTQMLQAYSQETEKVFEPFTCTAD